MALRPPHQALVGPPLPGPPGPPMMLPPMARAPGPPLGSMAALRPPLVSVDRELRVRGAVGREILILAGGLCLPSLPFPWLFMSLPSHSLTLSLSFPLSFCGRIFLFFFFL